MSIYKYVSIISLMVCSFLFSQDVVLSLDGSSLNYVSTADIAGFQFNHDGCATNAGGGDAVANGMVVSGSATTVLAFSFTGSVIPAGSGVLVDLGSEDCTEESLSSFIFSDSNAQPLVVVFDSGTADDGGDDGGGEASCSGNQDVCLSLDGSSLNYDSSADIAGFQFNHDGCATGANGGDAAANGMVISASGTTVLAFSFTGSVIPAGSGVLVDLGSADCTDSSLSSFVFSGSDGDALAVEVATVGGPDVEGCTNSDACNYDPDATVDDGSCEYAEENFDCEGNCVVDIDCSGECGGDAVVDECGECDSDPSNDCEADCNGEFGGDAIVDECGVCDGDGSSCSDDG